MVDGDKTGQVMFFGKGAGKEATASAVVADIMDCIKHINSRKYVSWADGDKDFVIKDYDEVTRLYVRIKSDDFNQLLIQFENIFSNFDSSVIKNEFSKEIAFITQPELESETLKKLSNFKNCNIKILHTLNFQGD